MDMFLLRLRRLSPWFRFADPADSRLVSDLRRLADDLRHLPQASPASRRALLLDASQRLARASAVRHPTLASKVRRLWNDAAALWAASL